MKYKILSVIICILSICLVTVESSNSTTFFEEKEDKEIKVKDTLTNNITKMDLENYVVGVIAAEMPASFSYEALKAQAVASRTYALFKINTSKNNFDVVTDVSNQGYIDIEKMKEKWGKDFDIYYNKIKKAVDDTKGKVMYYNGEVVEAYYFAMSNGYTEKASLVFAVDKDYLQSVQSEYDKKVHNFLVTKKLERDTFCKMLDINCESINISEINRSDTGRVISIQINNKFFKGTDLRKILDLRSTDFVIDVYEANVEITTKGYGHGVGMSQYGADGLAKNGYNYEDILKYFYKNIEIITI